jgi:hypothetical protein
MKNHNKNFRNRNFVVKLAHFALKRSKKYRNRGFNSLSCNLPEGMVHCLGISRRAILVLGGSFSTKIGRHGFG